MILAVLVLVDIFFQSAYCQLYW